MVRKKWLSPYFSTYLSYIHQTCTNCSSWHDLLISRGGLCPWPTFHAWVTVVRKKWLSPYYSTYLSYIHQTCTNCSSWHDLLIPLGGLCPWPTFHAWVTKTQNGYSGAPVMVPITIMSSYYLMHMDYAVIRQSVKILFFAQSLRCLKIFTANFLITLIFSLLENICFIWTLLVKILMESCCIWEQSMVSQPCIPQNTSLMLMKSITERLRLDL